MYNMLVFISRKFLLCIYSKGQTFNPISIDGNKKITYESEHDFSRLISAIKKTFNVNEFSQAPLSVIIVNCSAENKYVDRLYEIFSCFDYHSVVKAENIIPYVFQSKNILDEKNLISIPILDCFYEISEQNNVTMCLSTCNTSSSSPTQLEPEFFSVLFNPDYINSQYSNAKEAIANKDKLIADLESKLKHKEKEICDLSIVNENNQKLEREISENKKKIQILSEQIESNQIQYNKLRLVEKRELLVFNLTDEDLEYKNTSGKFRRFSGYVSNSPSIYPILFKNQISNATFVSKGTPILTGYLLPGPIYDPSRLKELEKEINKGSQYQNSISKQIIAPKSGKIFLFNSSLQNLSIFYLNCSLTNTSVYYSQDIVVGVVVDKNDQSSESEIHKWFETQLYKHTPLWLRDHCSTCVMKKAYNCKSKNRSKEMWFYGANAYKSQD